MPHEIIFIAKFARNFFFVLTLLLFVSLSLSFTLSADCDVCEIYKHIWCDISDWLQHWNIETLNHFELWYTLAFALNSCAILTFAIVFAVVANEIFHIGLVICCLQGRFTDLFGNFSCVRQPFKHIHRHTHTFGCDVKRCKNRHSPHCKWLLCNVCKCCVCELFPLKPIVEAIRTKKTVKWNINNIIEPVERVMNSNWSTWSREKVWDWVG